jgi:ADP-ribose pyrophosphatase YjhB (NUDIX family)
VSIAVVRDGRVLLVKRANVRAFGLWSLPGGHVELGEPVRKAALRELAEETGVEAEIERLIDCLDIITRNPAGEVDSHYVLSVFAARWLGGAGRAASDVSAVMWAAPADLDRLAMTPGTADLIRRLLAG